uniref:E3 ubiquitin-protein ligase listerin n=1 Tax=Lygus hesperus TaxID=30085 RepID=A0A146LCN7_LYGHE
MITVNLKLLNKSSDVTKQKALHELIKLFRDGPEKVLTMFVVNVAEAIIHHARYPHVSVRILLFTLLKTMMGRGKEVKHSLVPSLNALAAVWVCAMNEMERSVRSEAKSAFEIAFSPDKRVAML